MSRQQEFALDFLSIPQPDAKPGTRWTIMTDLAMPLAYQASFLDTVSDILTRVKFAEHVSLVGRLPPRFFCEKNALYNRHGLKTFTGGVPFEIAHLQNKVQEYFSALPKLGFAGVEISTDCIADLTRDGRNRLIRDARNAGLEVYTELGNKIGELKLDVRAAADCIRADLEEGAVKVAIENESLCYSLKTKTLDTVAAIVAEVGISAVAFEVGPGGWPELPVWLLKEFGPDINVENLQYDRVLAFEAMRRGLHRSIGYTFFEGAGKA
ncbi:MAG TPA: phosphosulfolactate synthase [Burkholderiales bacterium]|nr:phosphosulfolactate synthase [Burkholderiales bacterium]